MDHDLREIDLGTIEVRHARDAAVCRPRELAAYLAGDEDLGGPMPGILDALAEGILRVAGLGGRANAQRRELIRTTLAEGLQVLQARVDEELGRHGLGAMSSAEMAAELSLANQESLRRFLDDFFGDDYRRALQADRELSNPSPESRLGHDPAFA